jgi:hypothetical protein
MNKAWLKRIEKAAENVQDGDLYDALHHVGDDPVKSEIEDVLKDLLPTSDFKKVVAVFKIATEE